MGDRGNIVVKQWDGGSVYLYTHWGGSSLPSVLQTALAKRWRWNDPSYLTRIIFDVMTAGEHDEETGYGISTDAPDNEHPFIVVDCKAQKVAFAGDPDLVYTESAGGNVWTFEEYIAIDDATLQEVFDS